MPDANRQGPNVGGIEQISFEHVERLHMEVAPNPADRWHPTGGSGPGTHCRWSEADRRAAGDQLARRPG